MLDEKNLDRTDAMGRQFGEMKEQLLPPPALEKAVMEGVPYGKPVRTRVHVIRITKAVAVYVMGIALFLGVLVMLPKLFEGGEPIDPTPAGTTPSVPTEPVPLSSLYDGKTVTSADFYYNMETLTYFPTEDPLRIQQLLETMDATVVTPLPEDTSGWSYHRIRLHFTDETVWEICICREKQQVFYYTYTPEGDGQLMKERFALSQDACKALTAFIEGQCRELWATATPPAPESYLNKPFDSLECSGFSLSLTDAEIGEIRSYFINLFTDLPLSRKPLSNSPHGVDTWRFGIDGATLVSIALYEDNTVRIDIDTPDALPNTYTYALSSEKMQEVRDYLYGAVVPIPLSHPLADYMGYDYGDILKLIELRPVNANYIYCDKETDMYAVLRIIGKVELQATERKNTEDFDDSIELSFLLSNLKIQIDRSGYLECTYKDRNDKIHYSYFTATPEDLEQMWKQLHSLEMISIF